MSAVTRGLGRCEGGSERWLYDGIRLEHVDDIGAAFHIAAIPTLLPQNFADGAFCSVRIDCQQAAVGN